MRKSHAELFSGVCHEILQQKNFVPRDFFNHPDLAEMQISTLDAMVKRFISTQLELGSIKQLAINVYGKTDNYENKQSKNQVRKDIQALVRADRELCQRNACRE